MSDDLITVYEAIHLAEAEAIHQALEAEGIRAFVEQTASPLDGLTTIGEGTEVMVLQDNEARARQIIDRYLAEGSEDTE